MEDRLLPAVQKAYDINRWMLPYVRRLPRDYKFTLGDRLQTTAMDICLALVEAAHARSKERPLHRANRLLDQLRLLLRLGRDVGVLSVRRHAYVSALNEELGRMIGGWLRASRSGQGGQSERALAGAPAQKSFDTPAGVDSDSAPAGKGDS